MKSTICKKRWIHIYNGLQKFSLTIFLWILLIGTNVVYGVEPLINLVTPPTDGTYKTGNTLNIQIRFDQVVNVAGGIPYIPVVLTTGTINAIYTGGSGTNTLTFSYNIVSGNSDTDGIEINNSIVLPGVTTIQNTEATPENAVLTFTSPITTLVFVDGIAPTVSLSSSETDPTSTNPIPMTAQFSETVSGFVVGDIVVGSGTAGSFVAVDGDTYTFSVTPTADAAVTVDIAGAVCQDAAGNDNDAATQLSITYDGTNPTVTISTSEGNPTNANPIPMTAEFSEAVSGFVAGDIVVGNGTAGSFVTVDGDTYTFSVTPAADGAVTVDIAGAVCQDAAGNDNDVATQLSITYDGTNPTVTISTSEGNPTNANPIPMTAEFSEAVSGFVAGDIVVGNGTAGSFVAVDGDTYTFSVTPTADGTITVDIAGAVCQDATGNDNDAATQLSITYDNSNPTLIISTSEGNPTNANPIPMTAEFSEAVSGFVAGDIVVGNGTAGSFVAVDGDTYTFSVTPAADGAVMVDIAGAVCQDATGNDNDAATQLSITYDGTNPTVTISTTAISPTNTNPIPITAQFSEAVSGFVAGDIVVGNGTAGSFVAVDGDTYTFSVTPAADGAVTVDLAGAVCQDAAGNDNDAATQLSITYDGTNPTVTISTTAISPTNTNPIPMTAQFSEAISGFVAGDIVVGNGTAGSFVAVDGDTYTFSVTPTADGEVTVDIAEAVCQDAAGNNNVVATQLSTTYDGTSPTKPTIPDLLITSDNGYLNTDNITNDDTPTFSGTAESGSMIKLYNETTEIASGSAVGINWSLTSIALTEGIKTIRVKAIDAAGNESDLSDALSVSIDLTKPTPVLSTTSADTTNVKPIPFTIQFNENVTGFELSDIDVVATDLTAQDFVTIAPDEYTFELDGVDAFETDISVDIATGVCMDYAGNTSNAAAQYLIRFDWDKPAVTSITTTTSSPTNASTIYDIAIQFDENVYHFSSGDLQISNCTIVDFDQVSGDRSKYLVDIAPISDGEVTIKVPANVCTDANSGGNLNFESATFSIISDKTKPTPTIGSSTTGPVNSSFTVTITFIEDVTGFDISDIILGNATKGVFSKVDDQNYTLVVNPTASGTVTVDIAANRCTDIATNSNNIATQFTILCDKTPPSLTSVSIQSDNSNSIIYAKVDDKIIVSFEADEPIQNVSAIINGLAATSVINTGGDNWTVSRTMLPGDSEGNISFNISFEDIAGNTATHLTGVTDGSNVAYYNTVPTLSAVSIISNYATHTDKSNVGSEVTLSFTSAKELDNVVVTILGNSVTATTADNYTWEATYTLQSSDNEGTIPFTIDFTDIPGNSGVRKTTITSGNYVTFDKTTPVLNVVTISSNNAHNNWVGVNGIVTVSITSSEIIEFSGASIESHSITPTGSNNSWTLTYTMTESDIVGNVDFQVSYVDLSGNTNTTSATTNGSSVTFDNIVPTLTSVSIKSNNSDITKAKIGDVVTVYFTADNLIEGVTASIDSKNAIVTNTVGNDWIAQYPISSSISEGTLSFDLDFKDYSGNIGTTVSSPNDGTLVIVDITPPLAPSKPDLDASFDTGINTDNITSITTPNFTGTAAASETVNLYSNVDGLIGTITADGTGAWTISSDALAEGAHIITATATDETGNIGVTSLALNVTIDFTDPVVTSTPDLDTSSDTGQSSSDNKTSDTTPTFIGTSEANSSVSIFSGATLLGTATTNTFGAWLVTSSVLVEGSYSITAEATDAAGNTSITSAALTIDVDITKPATPSTPDLDPSSDSGNLTDNVTNDNTPTFIGSAETGAIVKLYNGLTEIGNGIATGGSWSITSIALSDGVKTITVKATDASGNESDESTALIVTIDTSNPTKPTTPDMDSGSDNGTSSIDNITNNNTPTFTGTVEALTTVNLYSSIDGLVGTTTADVAGAWIIISDELTEGSHDITVFAIDESSNSSVSSNALTVLIDTQPPTIVAATVPSGIYKVGNIIVVTIESDNKTYTGQTISINGTDQTIINNNDNTYKVNYQVLENDNLQNAISNLPINIVLSDNAGNSNVAFTSANVQGGTLTIDSRTPQVASLTSNAEDIGILKIGDQILFTLTPAVAEEGLIILPASYNNEDITWSTIDGGITYTALYTIGDGDADQEIPLQLGNVTIADAAGNISDIYSYSGINKQMYGTKPTIRITGSTTRCDYPTPTVPITFTLTGKKPYTFTYSDGTENHIVTDLNADSYVVNVFKGTFTLVDLVDATGNTVASAIENATITVNPLPVVTLNITGSPYSSNALKDELSKYVLQADKRTGIFSGDGVGYSSGSYYFYPAAVEVQDVDIDIIYTYTNPITGCVEDDTSSVYVSSTPINIVSLNRTYCEYAVKDTVDGVLPVGHTGLFEVLDSNDNPYPIGWTQPDSITLVIDPQLFASGDYKVKYTALKLPLLEEVSDIEKPFTIEAKKEGLSIAGLLSKYCYDNTASEITFSAAGFETVSGDKGHFNGPSIYSTVTDSHSARFNYAQGEPNMDYKVSYVYESANGCISDTVFHTIHIDPLPQLSFSLQDNYNYNDGEIPLVGNYISSEYLFSGEGISRDTLYTSAARIDVPIVITYSYTDANNCSNQLIDTTIIYKATETIKDLNSVYCYSNSAVSISCKPNISDTITGVFSSYRNAIESSGKNTALYHIDLIGSGKDTVWYSYKINGIDYSVYKEVTVDSVGLVTISSLDTSYCTSVTKAVIFGSQDYLLGGTSNFTYNGSATAFAKFGSSAEIYPSKESPGAYDVTYTFTSNNGCEVSTSKSFNINAIPTPEFDSSIPSNAFIYGDPITLSGNYNTGTFSFSGTAGVIENVFYPNNAQVGDVILTYYVKDLYGCESQKTKTIKVLQANASIIGIPTNGWVCYYSDTLTLTGTSVNGIAGGEFIGDGIDNGGLGADKAYFYPKLVGGGEHSVRYKYKYIDGITDMWVDATIKVDSSDIVAISGFNDDLAYCQNDPAVSLLSNYSTAVFDGNGIVGKSFYPSGAQVGLNTISCTYTNTQSGCVISSTKDVTVKAIPSVNFSVENTCTDLATTPVNFTNLTQFDGTISEWQWYLDGVSDISSYDYNASHLYSTSGAKRVRLTAITSEGCSANYETIINVGKGSDASFVFYNECLSSVATRFECTSDASSIETYTWIINNETRNQRTIDYTFPKTGDFNIKLIVESLEHCKDSITKQITINPVIKITERSNSIYIEDFENEISDWFVKQDFDSEYSSWNRSTPTGDIINTVIAGEKAWFTNVNLENQHVENSQVLSPCFDFDTLSRPMLKFDIWSSPEEGRDGAVIQYSLDGGISWVSLGEVGEGLNWFNSNSIKSKPADDFLGWSKNTNGWVSARHNLESLKGNHLVRFRLMYAADAQAIQPFNGFAFDNVWIGNKQQNVLYEYFTNTNLSDASSYYPEVKSVEQNLENDILPIHYHTSYPSGDPLNQFYTSGPSSRVYFYGVSQIPYANANGDMAFTFPAGLNTTTYFSAMEDSIDVKSLYDPKVGISIAAAMNGSTCSINVGLTNNVDLTGNNIVLQCAVVKSTVDVSGTTYFNVLRSFVPDAGGTVINSNLGAGESQNISLSWTPVSNDELVNASLVAFIQNQNTNEVYQTSAYDLSGLTSISPVNKDVLVDIYPNPTSDQLFISCEYDIKLLTITDITGRAISSFNLSQKQITLPVQNLKCGVYILKGTTSKGDFIRKFIKE